MDRGADEMPTSDLVCFIVEMTHRVASEPDRPSALVVGHDVVLNARLAWNTRYACEAHVLEWVGMGKGGEGDQLRGSLGTGHG
eukprot:11954752-Alexandrium_andersonii.AAC.1